MVLGLHFYHSCIWIKVNILGKIHLDVFHPSEVFLCHAICVFSLSHKHKHPFVLRERQLFAIGGLLPILFPLLWSDIREFVHDRTHTVCEGGEEEQEHSETFHIFSIFCFDQEWPKAVFFFDPTPENVSTIGHTPSVTCEEELSSETFHIFSTYCLEWPTAVFLFDPTSVRVSLGI